MPFTPYRWLKISLINLLIVSLIGVVLRYKILFSLPFLDQKHLLHGHSHFAFTGWLTQVLMALLVGYLYKQGLGISYRKYNWLLSLNLLSAYGMLIFFPIQGYGLYSIFFSTLSIFVSYTFAILFWKDLNKLSVKSISHYWFKAAFLFNAISSAGTFSLAVMMITKSIQQHGYLAAIYFFLHFQYNGWFFFTCMGLLNDKIQTQVVETAHLRSIFWLFAIACVPAYFLSALWLDIPAVIYATVIIAAFLQVIAWVWLVKLINKNWLCIKKQIPSTVCWILGFSAFALSIKLLLQLGSVIPALSDLAFGFRPIVIGYLHLVLLAVITVFIIGYLFTFQYINVNKISLTGLWIFVLGILFNEILLMVQGVGALYYVNVSYINEMLLLVALLMFIGLLTLNAGQLIRKKNSSHTLSNRIL